MTGAVVGCLLAAASATAGAERPNILFILSDDLSYRDLGCYGQQHIETPNLDRVYNEAMRFTQAYAGACECAPSRCSLMTGLHMGHARIRLNRSVRGQEHLLDEDVTVAEVLKRAGYATGFFGKWGIGMPGSAGVPYKQGFDVAFGYYDQRRAHTFFPEYLYRNEKRIDLPQNVGFDMARAYRHQGVKDPKQAVYSENLICDEALKFIREHRAGPFFVYYATQLPHGPVVTPNLRQYRQREGFPDLRHREWAAMITHMDESVGRIVHLLKDLGIDDNTVIFFAGDNGYSHWGYMNRRRWLDDPFFHNKGPWRGGKFTSTEGGVRVPLLVRWPGKIKPGDCDHLCAFWDFLPTAAELARLAPPEGVDGVSLVPILTGQPARQKHHDYLYWENTHVQAARKGRYRAHRLHPTKPMEVYDLVADEASTKDLARERPDLVRQFERIFREARVNSQWYVNPGESSKQIKKKKKRAAAAGQLIPIVPPNARSAKSQ